MLSDIVCRSAFRFACSSIRCAGVIQREVGESGVDGDRGTSPTHEFDLFMCLACASGSAIPELKLLMPYDLDRWSCLRGVVGEREGVGAPSGGEEGKGGALMEWEERSRAQHNDLREARHGRGRRHKSHNSRGSESDATTQKSTQQRMKQQDDAGDGNT